MLNQSIHTFSGYEQPPASAGQQMVDAVNGIEGSWATYVPVMSSSGTQPKLGVGSTVFGTYQRWGSTVLCQGGIIVSNASTAAWTPGTGIYQFSLPVPAYVGWQNPRVGLMHMTLNNAGILKHYQFGAILGGAATPPWPGSTSNFGGWGAAFGGTPNWLQPTFPVNPIGGLSNFYWNISYEAA